MLPLYLLYLRFKTEVRANCFGLCIFQGFFVFFLRDWGREGGREGEKHQWVAFPTPPSGDLAHNPGVLTWLEVESATFWFTGWCSVHWATPARAHVEILTPKDDGIRKWGLGKRRRSWGWSLHEWDLCSYKRDPADLHHPSTMWGHGGKVPAVDQEVGSHQNTIMLAPWPWTFQILQLWEINFCFYKLPSLWYFVTAAWVDQDTWPYGMWNSHSVQNIMGKVIRMCSCPSFPHLFHLIALKFVITGIIIIWGRGCGLHLGGVAAVGSGSEGPVQGCDVGELQQPGVSGWGQHHIGCLFLLIQWNL